jgi:hypothetical protein
MMKDGLTFIDVSPNVDHAAEDSRVDGRRLRLLRSLFARSGNHFRMECTDESGRGERGEGDGVDVEGKEALE